MSLKWRPTSLFIWKNPSIRSTSEKRYKTYSASARVPENKTPPPASPTLPLEQLIAQRQKKLATLHESGVDQYPYRHPRTHTLKQLLLEFEKIAAESESPEKVRTAGRLLTIRDMGKSCFAHLADGPTRLQIYVKQKDESKGTAGVGDEAYHLFKKNTDLGDFVGVEGTMFRTKTQELTLRVTDLTLLAKALRPLPEKWHGLKDVETRYRQRELDLASNPAIQELFIKRSLLIRSLRQTLQEKGFLEVETPLLQPQAGGAAARPFETFHNALQIPLFMRIAPELYLKRLLVGGLDRVFEIGRVFRNEGVDTRHNPEFTILEAYQAYADYTDMMSLCEKLVTEAAKATHGSLSLLVHEKPISLEPPFARASLTELFVKHAGHDVVAAWQQGHLRDIAQTLHVTVDERTPDHKIFDRLFDAKIKPH